MEGCWNALAGKHCSSDLSGSAAEPYHHQVSILLYFLVAKHNFPNTQSFAALIFFSPGIFCPGKFPVSDCKPAFGKAVTGLLKVVENVKLCSVSNDRDAGRGRTLVSSLSGRKWSSVLLQVRQQIFNAQLQVLRTANSAVADSAW